MTTAARTGDPVLAAAAAAAAGAGQDGQVTQYLAGVPDLLHRYGGPGGDPYGQAVIAAAMDATRLGHASPLPAALLQEAAVGYLTDAQRTTDIASLAGHCAGLGRRGAPRRGPGPAARPARSRHRRGRRTRSPTTSTSTARRTRQDQLGPSSLWDALAAHADSASDLTRLGRAARDRGLYRRAAALWTTATTRGSADAAGELIAHLHQVRPGDTARAACWAAGHASLDDPRAVAGLLGALREAGASDAVTTLLARDPAGHASLDNPGASPGCWGRCARPGPATRSPPWPPGPPATPASTTRGPSPSC